jgi:hypothetical protein
MTPSEFPRLGLIMRITPAKLFGGALLTFNNKYTVSLMNVKFKTIASIVILVSAAITAPVFAEPQFSLKDEAAANPNVVNAIHEMNKAITELEAAPNDFGEYKVKAIADLRAAIISSKNALNYRLQKDEDHLDGSTVFNH